MTSAAEGRELTQVGAGTVMGELMRQYWIPAAQSAELVRDGAPIRLMLLGEKLIAFRDTEGRVGVMDHRCPHRCASLFLGRNEEGGIRCIYHGWKYDVAGNCVDMASVPPHQDFKHKVKAKAYQAVERASSGSTWGRWLRSRRCRRSKSSTCPMTKLASPSSSATAITCKP
jgi:nitrite reductase/ring-hydroxylating ferredoxin subunit